MLWPTPLAIAIRTDTANALQPVKVKVATPAIESKVAKLPRGKAAAALVAQPPKSSCPLIFDKLIVRLNSNLLLTLVCAQLSRAFDFVTYQLKLMHKLRCVTLKWKWKWLQLLQGAAMSMLEQINLNFICSDICSKSTAG